MFNRVCESVFLVGGGNLSDPRDCLIYLVDLGDLVLIDCGAGPSFNRIFDNIREAGFEPERIHTLILTHCHIDHIGAAFDVKNASNCRVVAHKLDAKSIETADSKRTAADWYGLDLKGVPVDLAIDGERETLSFASGALNLIHTPGHTPGSMAAVVETPDNHRVLFGQDIHGPFSDSFDSNIDDWRKSMNDVMTLDADILCEGHFGVFRGSEKVREFIEEQLDRHI